MTSKRPEAVANTGARRSQFEDYTSTHLSLLVSSVVVNGAIEKAKLRSLPSFADSPRDELTDDIIDGFSVTANSARRVARAGNILTVSFVGTQAEDCAIIIRAILASYQSFLAETYEDMSEDAVSLITKARDLLDSDLKKQEKAYREFREISPVITGSNEARSPAAVRLSMIQEQQADLTPGTKGIADATGDNR